MTSSTDYPCGHPRTPGNTYTWRDAKICLQCKREKSLQWQRENRERHAATALASYHRCKPSAR